MFNIFYLAATLLQTINFTVTVCLGLYWQSIVWLAFALLGLYCLIRNIRERKSTEKNALLRVFE